MPSRMDRLTSKNYLQRTPEEFTEFKYRQKLARQGVFDNKHFGVSSTLLISDNYFSESKELERGRRADRRRNEMTYDMSNDELSWAIAEQLQTERENREHELSKAPQWVKDLDWNELLTKRIFKSSFI